MRSIIFLVTTLVKNSLQQGSATEDPNSSITLPTNGDIVTRLGQAYSLPDASFIWKQLITPISPHTDDSAKDQLLINKVDFKYSQIETQSEMLDNFDITGGVALQLMNGKLNLNAKGNYVKTTKNFDSSSYVVMSLKFISKIHSYHPERVMGPSHGPFHGPFMACHRNAIKLQVATYETAAHMPPSDWDAIDI